LEEGCSLSLEVAFSARAARWQGASPRQELEGARQEGLMAGGQ